MNQFTRLTIFLLMCCTARGQERPEPPSLLKPARVYDGVIDEPHAGWVVLVRNNRIEAVGPATDVALPADAKVIDLPDLTLMPGLIDAHTHFLLHPYNETPWEKQVLNEALSLRVCRATNHARKTLLAGFTTVRDLGTEGAGYADVGIKQSIKEGIIPGPRMLVTTRAIIATGTYAPKGFAPELTIPQGAEEADGESLRRVVRDQISKGADWIKVYADYGWGPGNEAKPTFSLEELKLIVETAKAAGVPVVAHATSKEGMRRATLAGVETIEHGYGGDVEIFRLMAKHGVALCPTLAAAEAMDRYRGWRKPKDESPNARKKEAFFKEALEVGVTIACGSDAGVFAHGDNAREIELMVEFGMSPARAVKAATSVAAKVLHLENQVGAIRPRMLADLIAVEGDPCKEIGALRKVRFVMKEGKVEKQPPRE